MDEDGLRELLELQDGVIARRQALALELKPHDIRRLVRRREWAGVQPGIFVNHTGPLTWQQRAWVAVLSAWPAALCHGSAIRAADGPGRRGFDEAGPFHVAIDRTRTLTATPPGVVLHYLAGLDRKVSWTLRPPRVRIEQAVIDVAAEAKSDFDAVAAISNAVQARRTTAVRIKAALDARARIARREFLAGVLTDVASGTCSVLEHGYLDRVERPHGLPPGQRQVGASARGPIYRDVTYVDQGLVVELDGRLFHDSAESRDHDLDRDLDAQIDGLSGVRLGWGQVFKRPCVTAVKVARLLQQRGWDGAATTCPDCLGEQRPALVPSGDSDPGHSAEASA